MNYTVTDVPLKKIQMIFQAKHKCEHHKFADGIEFMMYTITARKKETLFIFDLEDFDVINGREWYGTRNYIKCVGQNGYADMHLIYVIGDKQYPDKNVALKKYGPDYRKSNFVVY
ncbi:MAG: hypothetical protein Faunusvirus8_35 [Faunusvirus sp.]|jgi:hypothetical protein|uniref:Uncharacterized protein n=1 Tax=Faunusvirus sp. TaxID=2487766 RepID=A0A3G4ZWM9_9VIRU|nr:MAG: hypothetical protein Faunusvirus8_35 [Faunusvirus sp.]